MKRRIFTLVIIAILVAFASCEKEPSDKDNVTLTFSDEIIIDLGSSDEDVLAFVSASDNSTVSVSGINYNMPGEHMATFTTGKVSEKKAVKIKADKLAGTYYIAWYSMDDQKLTEGDDEAWKIKITAGDQYNQIKIPSTIYSEQHTFFPDFNELVVSFDAKEGASIPDFRGKFAFMSTPAEANFSFTDIEFGLVDGKYAIQSFKMEAEEPDYTDFYYTASFVKQKD